MTRAESAERGKAARRKAPRSSHGEWEPAADRDDPVAILEGQAASRVSELVPLRYGRMSASPFAFFRGAAAVMAADLAPTPASGLKVQACGDAHLSNFGIFAAPDRRLVFDLNDFDETLPGPWEWDLKRLAASFAISARELGQKRGEREAALLAVAASYREAMGEFATMRNIELWFVRLDVEEVLARLEDSAPRSRKRLRKGVAKAWAKGHLRALERLTTTVDGEPRFASQPPLLVPAEELFPAAAAADLRETLLGVLASYRETLAADRRHLLDGYRLRHIARKVVGVGSVGTRAWVLLLTGAGDDDPLFLQAKEAQASVLEPYAGRGHYRSNGRRVVEGQRLMQAASDVLLGWCAATGIDGQRRDFYVRQLWDGKRSIDIERLGPDELRIYARVCGWTLARAHARSGDRHAIAAYLGRGDSFDRALAEFAERYADQNEHDHAALVTAVESGRVESADG